MPSSKSKHAAVYPQTLSLRPKDIKLSLYLYYLGQTVEVNKRSDEDLAFARRAGGVKTAKRFWVRAPHVFVCEDLEDGLLIGLAGNGDTVKEALADLARNASNKVLQIRSHDNNGLALMATPKFTSF